MNKSLNLHLSMALLLAAVPVGASAQTTFFTDTFSSGSTTNQASIRGGSPPTSFTSYDIASSKTAAASSTVTPNDLHLALSSATTSGYLEAQALFATNGHAVTLTVVGDYIDVAVVFTNTGGTLLAGGVKSSLWLGLYNSGGSLPVAGGLLANGGLTTTAGSPYATGNCANWQGYIAQVTSSGSTRVATRPLQNGALTDSADQELCGNNASGGTYDNPAGTTIETAPVSAVTLTSGAQYTMDLRLTLNDVNSLTVSNFIYSGAGTSGPVILSQGSATGITNATYLTGGFDGLAIGAFNSGTSFNPTMDISSILITGQSTAVTTPPTITSEPVPVLVATNGSSSFSVGAVGFGVTYQWYRNNTLLVNGGHISGATSGTLVISPSETADAFAGANGYYAVVSGTGGFSTNSTTNSLTLIPATSLTWSGSGSVWDLATSENWVDTNGNPEVFNYGDPVTFDDTGAANTTVTLSGSYLSPASVTINSSYNYSFTGSGSIAGAGAFIYAASPFLSINTPNTFSGGTVISNATSELYLYLQNYNGLGTGPVTLDNNPNPGDGGGKMEIVPTGGASLGINGTVNVLDDFTIQVDATGTYATVFLGDLSGTTGKTLTINPKNAGLTNRFRAYGINTVYNANLALAPNDVPTSEAIYNGTVLAPYEASGSQTYNGIISGYGGIVQRGNGTTVFNGQNTYSGGTFATAGGIAFGVDTTVDGGGNVLSGPIGTGPLFVNPEVGSGNGSGTVQANNGARTIANPIQYPSATNNQTLIFGGTNTLTMAGGIALNGQDATTPAVNRTLQVNNTNTLTIISGVISDGGAGFGLIKTGTGILALNNSETYAGPTMVNAGTLLVNGQLAAGSAVTATNGTLGGSGTILGPVTVQGTNSTLAPGNLAIGRLTINNNLSLSGNVAIVLNKSVSPSNSAVTVTGTLANTGTGTVTVTNLGPALVAGDRFVLFSQALGNGSALTVSGAGVNWTNDLAVDGSITVLSVIGTVNTNAFTITNRYASGALTLSWPLNHTGYRLEAQTNTLAKGLATNWVTVSNVGSLNPALTNQVSIPVSATNPTVFYRLIYP